MNTHRTLVALALIVAFAAGAAQASDLEKEPGYVDLEWIEIPDDAEEIKDIDLTPLLLDVAKEAEEEGDDALMQALAMVHSIRVKAWSSDYDDDATGDAVKRITTQLKKDDWKRLVYMKDRDETVAVSVKYDDDDMVGLMLVVHEPGDAAAFVNVVGNLDLATLFKLVGMIESEEFEGIIERHDH